MNIKRVMVGLAAFTASLAFSLALVAPANADAGDEGRLLLATQVIDQVQGMPDQRIPDMLLSRAYGIAVIPDVTKIAFIFGAEHGRGVLVVRDNLTSPWSNPAFVSWTGGSWGFQLGAQSSDIILVFTTKTGIDGISGGRLTLGADASVAAGPVGRQGAAATDLNFNSEIYAYARTRGLFGGVSLGGRVIHIDAGADARFYGRPGVTASQIFSDQAPAAPPAAQRFLERLAQDTGTAARSPPAPQAESPASEVAAPQPPAETPRTFPLEEQPAASAAPPR